MPARNSLAVDYPAVSAGAPSFAKRAFCVPDESAGQRVGLIPSPPITYNSLQIFLDNHSTSVVTYDVILGLHLAVGLPPVTSSLPCPGYMQARPTEVSPLECALPEKCFLTPLESALPKSLDLKSFRMNTSKKTGGRGVVLPKQIGATEYHPRAPLRLMGAAR